MSNTNKLERLSIVFATAATILVVIAAFGDKGDLLWIAYVCMMLAWTLRHPALKTHRKE